MRIKRTDPLSGQALDSPEVKEPLSDVRFAEAFSKAGAADTPEATGSTEAAEAGAMDESSKTELSRIAHAADLSNTQELLVAVRKSARVLVKSRLGTKLKDTAAASALVEDLSDQIAADQRWLPL